ncbi:hypothetical protein KY338_07010 [Candidatus Woesearchaeota archaeon]|nr:hypothetical protein [Candidatus Woesearchaeota archaeon]MBW3005391.1 hypothetical protein [Candidatus Woesearchaeota archaeon]
MEKKETTMIILGIVAVIAVVGLVLLFKQAMAGATVTATNYYQDPYMKPIPAMNIYAQQQACKTLGAQHIVPALAVMPAKADQVAGYGADNCFKTPAGSPVEYCCIQPRPY